MSDRHSSPSETLVPPGAKGGRRFGFPDLGRFWTWANALTMSRIVLVPFIALLVYRDGPMLWLVALILVAVATDYFDGKVARYTGTVSEWGKVLDPLADKLAAAAVTLALVIRPVEPTLDLWFVILVIVRDLVIASGGVLQTKRIGFVLMALWSGKVAVNLLALTIVAVLFGGLIHVPHFVIEGLVFATAVALLYSLGLYLYRFAQVMRYGPATPLNERHEVMRNRLPGRR